MFLWFFCILIKLAHNFEKTRSSFLFSDLRSNRSPPKKMYKKCKKLLNINIGTYYMTLNKICPHSFHFYHHFQCFFLAYVRFPKKRDFWSKNGHFLDPPLTTLYLFFFNQTLPICCSCHRYANPKISGFHVILSWS